jgi:C_GCAxxG_C_C family probable redox protein
MQKSAHEIVSEASELFAVKYHCSEAIVISVGSAYMDSMPEILIRTSCAFGGGVGGCREELCGLLSGANIVLGALWGRTTNAEDDKWLYEVICDYRNRFITAFGETPCLPLRDRYKEQHGGCGPLVEDSTRMLIDLIEETADRLPEKADRLAQRVTL